MEYDNNGYNNNSYNNGEYNNNGGYSNGGDYNSEYRYSYTFEPQSAPRYTPPSPEVPAKKKKGWTTGRVIALALICALLGGAGGVGGVFLGLKLFGGSTDSTPPSISNMYVGEREPVVINTNKTDASKLMTPSEVYASNVNSTVGIRTTITYNVWGNVTRAAAAGSGFILTDDGFIVTNYHVVENSSAINVTLYDGREYPAELKGIDKSNDIAVIKIDEKDLTPVVLGSSDSLNVGDSVIAIGNPLGELTFSLTCGYVSALDREVTFSGGITMDLIQTDCAINSGNSGGALFNLYGEVVGITNAKYSGKGSSSEASIDNIGFAIPIDSVRNIIRSIIETGEIRKPYIGVSVIDVSSEALSYGIPQGAAIVSVIEGGPADKAGLKPQDIIIAVDGTPITGKDGLTGNIGVAEVGQEFTITVYRRGEELDFKVTVGEQVTSALPTPEPEQSVPNQGQQQFPNFWDFFG